MEDKLIIVYDCNPPDIPTLCVMRDYYGLDEYLNVIQGDKAIEIYELLTSKNK